MSGSCTSPMMISGDESLANFLLGLTGDYALQLLDGTPGGMLIQLPVGVGKTRWLVQIVSTAIAKKAFDLVVVLVPRWDVLCELQKVLPGHLRPVVLSPRPRECYGDL